jgi:hypothetical protein
MQNTRFRGESAPFSGEKWPSPLNVLQPLRAKTLASTFPRSHASRSAAAAAACGLATARVPGRSASVLRTWSSTPRSHAASCLLTYSLGTGVRLHPPGRTDKNLCRCFPAAAPPPYAHGPPPPAATPRHAAAHTRRPRAGTLAAPPRVARRAAAPDATPAVSTTTTTPTHNREALHTAALSPLPSCTAAV